MKKVFSIVLAMVMAFALTACKGENAAKGTLTVGVIQLAQHPSLDEIYAAFEKQLNEEATKAGITVKIDYQNGQGDPTNINTICQKFVGDKVDAIVAIATPAAQGAAAAAEGSNIPIVFSAVTDPVEAQLVMNPSAPEGNITGTSDAIPVDKIFALAKELTPNVKSFGIVYNMGEPNSVVVVEQAKKYLADNGITLEESPITASGEVQMAAKNLSGKCDAIFVPIDNMVANAMPVLAQEAIAKGKPVYAAADSLVRDGALASVGVNYTNLGKKTADMLIKVLQGTAIKDIPVEILSDNAVVVNADTAKALNIDVSKYNK
ncbi:MAG: ABC transporter substrate-binding protein [Oscillospiraceae bacterium]